jgi:hypothetical protein
MKLDVVHCTYDCGYFIPHNSKRTRRNRPNLWQRREPLRDIRLTTMKHELVLDEVARGRTKVILVPVDQLDQRSVLAHLQQRVQESTAHVGGDVRLTKFSFLPCVKLVAHKAMWERERVG